MAQEEIERLAKEYAHIRVFDGGFFDKEEEVVEYDFALPVIQWLSKDYCIVPKSQVVELYNKINKEAKQNRMNGFPDFAEWNVIQLELLEIIFGKELFNKTEE